MMQCICVQAAQQGDSTKVDKRRKKKQKEQAEDEAFLDNAQDDAEYQQGASGIPLSHRFASLLPQSGTPTPVSAAWLRHPPFHTYESIPASARLVHILLLDCTCNCCSMLHGGDILH